MHVYQKLNSRLGSTLEAKGWCFSIIENQINKDSLFWNIEIKDNFDKNDNKEDNINREQRIKIQQVGNLCL